MFVTASGVSKSGWEGGRMRLEIGGDWLKGGRMPSSHTAQIIT